MCCNTLNELRWFGLQSGFRQTKEQSYKLQRNQLLQCDIVGMRVAVKGRWNISTAKVDLYYSNGKATQSERHPRTCQQLSTGDFDMFQYIFLLLLLLSHSVKFRSVPIGRHFLLLFLLWQTDFEMFQVSHAHFSFNMQSVGVLAPFEHHRTDGRTDGTRRHNLNDGPMGLTGGRARPALGVQVVLPLPLSLLQ